MYTRTHTHTQARTHTTKFSGHVVRFFFFRCFLFSSSPFVFRREGNYLVHLFFTALVVHRNKHSHRTQSWRHSTDARTYAALLRHVTSTVRLRLNRDTFTTERPHFFFFHVVPRCVVMVTRRQSPEEAWPAKFSNMRAIISHVGFSAVHTFERMHDSTHNVKTRTHSEWK